MRARTHARTRARARVCVCVHQYYIHTFWMLSLPLVHNLNCRMLLNPTFMHILYSQKYHAHVVFLLKEMLLFNCGNGQRGFWSVNRLYLMINTNRSFYINLDGLKTVSVYQPKRAILLWSRIRHALTQRHSSFLLACVYSHTAMIRSVKLYCSSAVKKSRRFGADGDSHWIVCYSKWHIKWMNP